MTYEVQRKKSDLKLLLFSSIFSVLLQVLWETIIYFKINDCDEFQRNIAVWEAVLFNILRTISVDLVPISIFYIIFWKHRQNL